MRYWDRTSGQSGYALHCLNIVDEMVDAALEEKMTWKEFKEAVEREGVKDDDIIGYIDVSLSAKGGVSIRFTKKETPRRFCVEQ